MLRQESPDLFSSVRTQNLLLTLPFITQNQVTTKYRTIIRDLFEYVSLIAVTILSAIIFYNFFKSEDTKAFIQNLSAIGLACQSLARIYVVLRSKLKIQKIIREIEEITRKYDAIEFGNIWTELSKTPTFLVKLMFTCLSLAAPSFYCVQYYNAVFRPDEFSITLYKFWPYDYNINVYVRCITLTYVILAGSILLLKIFVIQHSLYIILNVLNSQLSYVKLQWSKLFTRWDLPTKQEFQQVTSQRQEILRVIQDFNEILSKLVFIAVCGILWNVCLLGPIILNERYFTLQEKVVGVSTVATFLFQLGIICHSVELIQHQHLTLSDSSFTHKIFHGPLWLKKSIYLSIQRSVVQLRFNSLGFFVPSLLAFKELTRLIFSISIALLQIERKIGDK